VADLPEIGITAERSAYQPGEMVRARVLIAPHQNLTIRGGTARLLCVGDYLGASSKYHSGKAQVIHFEQEQSFAETTRVIQSDQREYELLFTIPEDAIPSYKGRIIDVAWKLLGKLDIPRAADRTSETHIEVLRTMLPGSVDLEMPRRGSICAVEFELISQWIAADAVLEGAILVSPKQDLRITGATLELVRVELVYTGTVTRTNRVKEEILEIGSSGDALRGRTERLGFRINIPANAQPFLAVPQARAYHELRAKIAIKGHFDCAISIPLLIHNTPIAVRTDR
jgi:hypothetical protein